MHLALGTVQFGMRYGIAGRGSAIPDAEARTILARAASLGITVLDTASAYGDIEARLAELAGGIGFRVVTKLPPVPTDLDGDAVERWISSGLQMASQRLGSLLDAVLFHRADDLLAAQSDRIWSISARYAAAHGFRLGVSAYDPNAIQDVCRRYPISMLQVPGNAFDQRLRECVALIPEGIEIHVRSAFLQGLLLMSEDRARERVPRASEALVKWRSWCARHALEPLVAALGLVKGLPRVSYCVVGVDRLEHLNEIATAWRQVPALNADELRVEDLEVIDPRRWPSPS